MPHSSSGRSPARELENRKSPVGYLQLARANANFRNLWFGQIISLLGDWFNLIASASLIGQLTGSGLAIGGLFVVRMLAPFLISPIGGVLADRYNRKHILILSDMARALVVLGFLLVRSAGDVWLLYLLTAVQLAITGIFFPTRNAVLPDLVTRAELGTANTLTSVTWSIMLAVGAALGGLVAGGWGFQPAFIVDSLTFLLSAMFISRIAYTHAPGEVSADLRPAAVLGDYVWLALPHRTSGDPARRPAQGCYQPDVERCLSGDSGQDRRADLRHR
ncbi:MAG: MFS transporter [Anaerolineales bacterium]